MSFIRTESELLDAIRHRTIWVAECLKRINRFNGQHPKANVLVHSMDVYERVLRINPQARPEQLVWCCLHDVHELLSGDISRAWKSPSQEQRQEYVDQYLMHHLLIDLDREELDQIAAADMASGDDERMLWDQMEYTDYVLGAEWNWCDTVEVFVR